MYLLRAVDNSQNILYADGGSLDRVYALGLRVRLTAVFASGLHISEAEEVSSAALLPLTPAAKVRGALPLLFSALRFSNSTHKSQCPAASQRGTGQSVKNLVEFAPAGANEMLICFVRWRVHRTKHATPGKCGICAQTAHKLCAQPGASFSNANPALRFAFESQCPAASQRGTDFYWI